MLSSPLAMKAMLLAAGHGERMLPLTRLMPKPAIPVLGRPLAAIVLHRLALRGISTAVVNLHHQPDVLRGILGDGSELGLKELFYSYEDPILGTAGGLRKAAPFLRGGETILVRNADFLADIDLSEVTAAHLASGCMVTMVLAPHRPRYTVVEVDRNGRVLSFGGTPRADASRVADRCLFTGLQLLEEEALDRIPPDVPKDLVRDLYRDLVLEGEVASYVHRGFWWEFGTPLDYLEGSLELLKMDPNQRLRVATTDPTEPIGEAIVALGTGADFHAGVELRGGVALGFASLVAEGSRIEDSVIMPEAWIGPGSKLRRAIVGPGTEIPADFRGEDVLICSDPDPGASLPAETERLGGLLVRRLQGDVRPSPKSV
jgi:NDP-sugar pyrophosphorylase family protein